MINPRKHRILLSLLLLSIFAPGAAHQSFGQVLETLYAQPNTTPTRDNYGGAVGCKFQAVSNIIASHLGYFDNGNGLQTSHPVGIFSSTGTLLAQVTVPAGNGSYELNGYQWVPLDPPVLLTGGTVYQVMGQAYSGDGDTWNDLGSWTPSWDPYFVGSPGKNCFAVYGPGTTTWPPATLTQNSTNGAYGAALVSHLEIGSARVGVSTTNIAISIGQTVSVTGFASGAQPISYQWWIAPNTPVANQTNPVLSIPNAVPGNSGTYFLTASNTLGGEQSSNVYVSVTAYAPGFTVQPTNVTVFGNYQAAFYTTVTGTPPMNIQWQRNGTPIAGTATTSGTASTASSYVFYPTSANNGDIYNCFGSNYLGGTPYTATSGNATLTVIPNIAYPQEFLFAPGAINRTNYNGTVGGVFTVGNRPVVVTHLGFCAGNYTDQYHTNATLVNAHHVGLWDTNGVNLLGSVLIPSGVNPVVNNYIWQPLNPPLVLSANTAYLLGAEAFSGSDPWTDGFAPTWNPYYTTPSLTWATYGSAWPSAPTSGKFNGQIYAAPNLSILALTNLSAYVTPTNVVQVGGTSATLTVTGEGQAPVTVQQWYQNGNPLAGQTNATLTFTSLTNSNSGTYYVIVTNTVTGAYATSTVANVTIYTYPVIGTQSPSGYTNVVSVFTGANPAFSVGGVQGNTPFYYQWYTNNVAVSGATSTGYSFAASGSSPTNVYCVITNSAGSTTSMVWTVAVNPAPTAPYPQQVLLDNPMGYWRLNEGPDNGSGNAGTLAIDSIGGNNGIYTNVDLGQTPGYNSTTDPTETCTAFGTDPNLPVLDDDVFGIGIDFGTPTNNSAEFTIEAWVNGYTQTKDAGIVSKGYGSAEQFNLDTGSDSVTPSHAFRFFIRDAAGTTHGVSSSAHPDANGATWHHLVGVCDEANSNVTFYVDGASAGTAAVSPSAGVLASARSMLIGSRPSGSATENDYQFVGSINDVAVYHYALSAGQVAAHYSAAGVPPNLMQSVPASITVIGYQSFTIPVNAVGTPNLSYTWSDVGNSTNVASGSTNRDIVNCGLTISNTPPSWNGNSIRLTVSNTYGQTNVTIPLIVLTNPPSVAVDLPPQVQTATGKSYTYSVGGSGPTPYFYQWYHGAAAVSGQTNSTYTVTAGGLGSTSYFVVVSNAFGSVTSSVSTFTSIAQVSGYSYATNVLAAGAVGYWPLQETTAAAPVTLETNYGLLGAQGNAYYAITTANQTNVLFNQSSPLVGDSDPAAGFFGVNSSGASTGTNYAFVPHVTSALTLKAPLTFECWIDPTTTIFGDILGQGGELENSANWGGIRLSYSGSNPNLQVYAYYGSGGNFNELTTGNNTLTMNAWNHCVMTYDGTTFTLYINGVMQTNHAYASISNDSAPFTIGDGRWQGSAPGASRAFNGYIDEVAVYTNVLTGAQVSSHYSAGAVNGNYFQTITNDKPLLYYRMDCAGYTNQAVTIDPQAVNYGSAPVNGYYLPGVIPGGGVDATNGVLNAGGVASPINGVISCVDAGADSSFNPSGTQPFSAVAWVKGNPADYRLQTIMGHGSTNWSLNLDGTLGKVVWTLGNAGPPITSTNVLNDGKWHMTAGVYDGSKAYLYVDGQLNGSAATMTNGIASESVAHIYLGGDSDYTGVGVNQRYFSGNIAHAAFFTNALSWAQVQTLYTGVAITPTISLGRSGNNLLITYTGTLLSSTNVVGPYVPINGATSPYTASPTGAQVYYRASVP